MTRIIFLLLCLFSSRVNSQLVESKRYYVHMETELKKEVADKFGNFLETEVANVTLVSLKPVCHISSFTDSSGKETSEELCNCATCIEKSDIGVDTSRFGKEVNLKKSDFVNILNILYRPTVGRSSASASCYEPRHAIAFYDVNNKLIGYIEICFHCYAIRTTAGTPSVGKVGENDFKELKTIVREYLAVD